MASSKLSILTNNPVLANSLKGDLGGIAYLGLDSVRPFHPRKIE